MDSHREGHPRRWLILGVLNLSLVLIVASVSSLNLAIPAIQRALGATASELVWINASYALVFAGLLSRRVHSVIGSAAGARFRSGWGSSSSPPWSPPSARTRPS